MTLRVLLIRDLERFIELRFLKEVCTCIFCITEWLITLKEYESI